MGKDEEPLGAVKRFLGKSTYLLEARKGFRKEFVAHSFQGFVRLGMGFR